METKKSDSIKRRSPKRETSKQIVSSILEASKKIFLENDISNVTTNQIAQAAGVSIGSIYDYFNDKSEIASQLLDSVLQSYLEDYKQAVNRCTNDDELVTCLKDIVNRFFLEKRRMLRSLFLLTLQRSRLLVLFNLKREASLALKQYLINYKNIPEKLAENRAFFAVTSVVGTAESYIINNGISLLEKELLLDCIEFSIKAILNQPVELSENAG